MSVITKDQVEHIARLARLRLTEEQKEKMTKELGSILTYIEKLNQVDTKGVEVTAQLTGLENVFRKDETLAWWDGVPADLVQAAPEHEREFVKVKGVFDK